MGGPGDRALRPNPDSTTSSRLQENLVFAQGNPLFCEIRFGKGRFVRLFTWDYRLNEYVGLAFLKDGLTLGASRGFHVGDAVKLFLTHTSTFLTASKNGLDHFLMLTNWVSG